MLNMSSTTLPSRGPADDRSTAARIRDAAIQLFGEAGVAATSVRAVAAAAGVSPALVIHHFGSKDQLRVACDEHVAAVIRENKTAAMQQGGGLDPMAALRDTADSAWLFRYLARTLVDGSPHVAELVDELVADAVAYMEVGVEQGLLRPSDDPHGRAAILTLWSLGALVLHEHVLRLTGADLASPDPPDYLGYARPAVEMLAGGVMTEAMAAPLLAGLAAPQEEG
jgi:AcrR family transcriptional regulator